MPKYVCTTCSEVFYYKKQIITFNLSIKNSLTYNKCHKKIKTSYNVTFQIHEAKEPKGEKGKRRDEGSDNETETKSPQKYVAI